MQIVALQLAYYAFLSFSLLVSNVIFGYRSHLGQIFSPEAIEVDKTYSTVTIVANFLNIVFFVFAQAYIVEKANKCLDFSVTTFFFHFIFTCSVYGFPNSVDWWFVHAILVTCTVFLAEFVCMRLETAEIKLSVNDFLTKGRRSAKDFIENAGKMKKGKRSKKFKDEDV